MARSVPELKLLEKIIIYSSISVIKKSSVSTENIDTKALPHSWPLFTAIVLPVL